MSETNEGRGEIIDCPVCGDTVERVTVDAWRRGLGFSREDVDAIAAGVLALRESGCDLLAAELETVKARIAALLPPEDSNG